MRIVDHWMLTRKRAVFKHFQLVFIQVISTLQTWTLSLYEERVHTRALLQVSGAR